jgi:hypothetical protein
VELANDAEANLQRMQELLARNIFQAKRTANLQHGIEPPLGPIARRRAGRRVVWRPAGTVDLKRSQARSYFAPLSRSARTRAQIPSQQGKANTNGLYEI